MQSGPTLLGLEETADRLGMTSRTVWRLIARGDLTVVRLPGVRRTLIDTEDLARLIAAGKRRVGAGSRNSRAPELTGN
jgi:excisionase family DNA binding protein